MELYLPDLEYLALDARVLARESGRLPGILHSTIRGAFGHALRRVGGEVDPAGSSAYARVFEGAVHPSARGRGRFPGAGDPPPPFLVRCGINGTAARPRRRQIEKGGTLEFSIALLGFACDDVREVALAVENLAQNGLGTDRLCFELASLHARGLDGRRPLNLAAPSRPRGVPMTLLEGVSMLPGKWKLRTTTPLALRRSGKVLERPDLRQVVSATVRRLELLGHFHALQPASLDTARILDVIDRIDWNWTRCATVQVERESARQRRRIRLEGEHGIMELSVPDEEAARVAGVLLTAAGMVGIGHGVTQGLGQFELSAAKRTRFFLH